MTQPIPRNTTILSLIKGIRIASFNGKEITPIAKQPQRRTLT